jgi:lysophospholipase L1-like esterase
MSKKIIIFSMPGEGQTVINGIIVIALKGVAFFPLYPTETQSCLSNTSGFDHTKATLQTMPERQKLLLLGDSLTQMSFGGSEGWGRHLADRYQRRADVLNRGMSGYNTRWYLRYAEDYDIWKEPGKVVLVTIWFGANDAATLEQGIPLPEYQANLETIIDKAKESYPGAKILMISPPPVALDQRNAYLEKQFGEKASQMAVRTSKVTGTYAEACVKASKAKDVSCLNLFQQMTTAEENKDQDDVERFFCDGLHFSDTGNKFVSEALSKAISEHFPKLQVKPCSITGQFNNSGSACDDLLTSGPYHDAIKSKRKWEEAFE